MPHIKTLDAINLENVYEGPPTNSSTVLYEAENPYKLLKDGFCWTEIYKPIISYNLRDDISYISRKDDLLYDMHYKQSAVIKPPRYMMNNPCDIYLCNYLEENWNIYALPLVSIISSYIRVPVLTYYLDWTYSWMKKGEDIKTLDLILEYAFGTEDLGLLKLPPHTVIEQDGWKLTPVIEANAMMIDPNNFTKEEPFLPRCVPYSELKITPQMMKRIKPNMIAYSPVPKAFYSLSLVINKGFLSGTKANLSYRNDWLYSLDSIIISNGVIAFHKFPNISNAIYEMNFEDFQYCYLCNNECAVCRYCEFRDLLFCFDHSAMIKNENDCQSCKSRQNATNKVYY